MSKDLVLHCQNKIQYLLQKNLIGPNKSSWSSSVFYFYKAIEIKRGTPRLGINYKPLNKVLK